MRLAFFGSPAFAVPSLEGLIAAGHTVGAVYCQPPRPAGRGRRERRCAVHEAAETHELPVRTPARLAGQAEAREFAALALDAAIVVAYGLLLPPAFLAAPRLGCLNVHASLLPRWRGAAPIARAILAGDRVTGVSIMAMTAGLDAGPVLMQAPVEIADTTTGGELHDRLAATGAELIVRALEAHAAGALLPVPQPDEGAIYAAKIMPDDRRLDWRDPAMDLARVVRAFAPAPGAWCLLPGSDERLRVLAAAAVEGAGAPGTILDAGPDAGLTVACGQGALRLERVQRAGGRAMDAQSFLRGSDLRAGDTLE